MLKTEKISVSFGGLKAVNEVSVHIQKNKITGLIGPNGAGKTTFFNCISGVQKVDSGKVWFNGAETTFARGFKLCESGLARTYQVINLFYNLPVIENAMIGHHCRTDYNLLDTLLRTSKMRKAEQEAREMALKQLDLVGLLPKMNYMAGQLSYGEQRMLEIARALATEPKLLLLDEPAAGMNATEKENLNDILRKIAANGISILIIEHDMNVVMRVSDYIYVMNNGRLLAEGLPEEVRDNPDVIAAYLGGA